MADESSLEEARRAYAADIEKLAYLDDAQLDYLACVSELKDDTDGLECNHNGEP